MKQEKNLQQMKHILKFHHAVSQVEYSFGEM